MPKTNELRNFVQEKATTESIVIRIIEAWLNHSVDDGEVGLISRLQGVYQKDRCRQRQLESLLCAKLTLELEESGP